MTVADNNGSLLVETTVPSRDVSWVIGGLLYGHDYVVKVSAVSCSGAGGPASIALSLTVAVPGPVSRVTLAASDDRFVVSWSPPQGNTLLLSMVLLLP